MSSAEETKDSHDGHATAATTTTESADTEHKEFDYEKSYKVPWIDAERDEHGNPIPLTPDHLNDQPQFRVPAPTPTQVHDTLKILGVDTNELLTLAERKLFEHMVHYCWSAFDEVMRPVDSPPVELRFNCTNPRPVKLQPYRLNPAKLDCLKKQVQDWLRDGVIRPAKSPWSFPVLMLPKKGATPGTSDAFRCAIDFRRLNMLLDDDSYPNPRTDDVLSFLANRKFRTSLDVRWGYHNLRLSPDAQDLVTFSSQVGTYSYLRLPLGVKPAGGLFCRQLQSDLSEWLWRDLVTFVDDVTIGHADKQQHIQTVLDVFCHLARKGYSVKAKKVHLLAEKFVFLGHVSTPDGLEPSPSSVEALTNMPVPTAGPGKDPKKQLRSFLGLGSWVRRYIPHYSRIVEPLRRLTEVDVKFEWDEACQSAWDAVIDAVVKTKGVYHPDYRYPFHIRTDASALGFGGYLFQIIDIEVDGKIRSEERVIEYWSRACPAPMRKYDTRRLELIAVIMALEHFRLYIEGHRVKLQTDHRNLTFLRNNTSSSGQLARWAMRLDEFKFELDYCPGKSNAMRVPDCLSRNPIDTAIDTDEDGQPVSNAFFLTAHRATDNPIDQIIQVDAEGQAVNAAYLLINEIHENGPGCHVVLSTIRGPNAHSHHGDLQHHHAYVATNAVPELDDEATPDPAPTPFDFVDQMEDAITLSEIREHQQNDELCKRERAALPQGTRTRSKGRWSSHRFDLEDGILYHTDSHDRRQIVVPETLRHKVFRRAHEGPLNGHIGRDATSKNILERYWWPYWGKPSNF
ncbi:MAG: RNase H-like domain-containing protein [Pseudomonadota bacterium]